MAPRDGGRSAAGSPGGPCSLDRAGCGRVPLKALQTCYCIVVVVTRTEEVRTLLGFGAAHRLLFLSFLLAACGDEANPGRVQEQDSGLGDSAWDHSTASDGALDAVGDTQADADADPTASLPLGRKYFVFALMLARHNAAVARLSKWLFAKDGTVQERYWIWSQKNTPDPHNIDLWRAATGYDTKGCSYVCSVWTSAGFEPGALPKTREGTYDWEDGQIIIQWSGGFWERYETIDHGTYAELSIVGHNYENVSAVYAKAFGSQASLSTTATASAIQQSGPLKLTTYAQYWNKPTINAATTIYLSSYQLCASSPVLQGTSNQPSIPYDETGYHTYFVADPKQPEGRKVYWYHQLENVALTNNGCANPARGGHLAPLLQILDDQENFVGFVGVEASLYGTNEGGSIISWMEARH